MARCVIEKKKSLEITLRQAFKDVDGGIDLRKEVFGSEIPIAVLPCFEDDPRLPEEKLVNG